MKKLSQQYMSPGKDIFGCFTDSLLHKWERTLINRREQIQHKRRTFLSAIFHLFISCRPRRLYPHGNFSIQVVCEWEVYKYKRSPTHTTAYKYL